MLQLRGVRTIGSVLRGCSNLLIDVIAPPRCLVCGLSLQTAASLCAGCWSKLTLIEDPRCDRLGLPFAFDQGEGAISAAALADPPAWNRTRAAAIFNETSRQLVHSLKYRDRHEVSLLLSRLMTRAAGPFLHEAGAIVPVPLHRRRLWARRFNQSALLAQRIAAASRVRYWPELLERVRSTRPQVGLDPEERRKNVRRSFAVPDNLRPQVAGLSIVLVDDVMTTGATAGAAATALLAAGASRVDVLVFALVDAPKRLHI
jgi:ComF family protein